MASAEDQDDKVEAASCFLARAHEAIEAADAARSEAAAEALYKEAETWLFMASRCLNPAAAARRPQTLPERARRAPEERRSFQPED
jgi:hypothetical protein